MKTVSIHDAKTNLSRYIAAAKRGEQIFIGSYGKPEVLLSVPASLEPAQRVRPLGMLKGKVWVADDAFSPATDREIADLMTQDDLEWPKPT